MVERMMSGGDQLRPSRGPDNVLLMPKHNPSKSVPTAIPPERIEKAILLIRGEKVLLDTDLAELYDVETRSLIQAVKRNLSRFPPDFMFQLMKQEFADLRSQSVTSSWGGRRYAPYPFTEQGVAMLSSVLRSKRAIEVNIEIMRAFVRLRTLMASHTDLARKLEGLENRLNEHDQHFRVVFDTIRQLLAPPTQEQKKRRIGFVDSELRK
jgi:hypothetical protein